MSIPVTDRITRGTDNISPFALTWETDVKGSHVTVGSYTDMEAIPEWRRLPYMTCKVADENRRYTLGADITILGQTWTAENEIPDLSDVVYEPDIFDSEGYVRPDKIRNIFLNSSYVVASEAAMLALTTFTGNFVIRTDEGSIYVKLNNDSPSGIEDFAEITNPTSVISVNDLTGIVEITITGILARGTNLTDFRAAVMATPGVADLVSAMTNLTGRVDDLEAALVPQSYIDSHLIGESLTAPVFDAFLYYDVDTTSFQWIQTGTNLSISGGFLNAVGGGTGDVLGSGANTRVAYWSAADTITSSSVFTFTGNTVKVPQVNVFNTVDIGGELEGVFWYSEAELDFKVAFDGYAFGLTRPRQIVTAATTITLDEETHRNAVIYCTSNTAVTVNLPDLSDGTQVTIVKLGNGIVTLTPTGVGITYIGASTQLIQNKSGATVIKRDSTTWVGIGTLGYSEITLADGNATTYNVGASAVDWGGTLSGNIAIAGDSTDNIEWLGIDYFLINRDIGGEFSEFSVGQNISFEKSTTNINDAALFNVGSSTPGSESIVGSVRQDFVNNFASFSLITLAAPSGGSGFQIDASYSADGIAAAPIYFYAGSGPANIPAGEGIIEMEVGNTTGDLYNFIISPFTGARFTDTGFNSGGIKYAADYSAFYSDRSLIDRGFANGNYWKISGTTTLGGPSDATIQGGDTYGVYFQNLGYFEVNSSGGIKLIEDDGNQIWITALFDGAIATPNRTVRTFLESYTTGYAESTTIGVSPKRGIITRTSPAADNAIVTTAFNLNNFFVGSAFGAAGAGVKMEFGVETGVNTGYTQGAGISYIMTDPTWGTGAGKFVFEVNQGSTTTGTSVLELAGDTGVKLNIAPANDEALTQLLVRDPATGIIKYRTSSGVGGTYTFANGLTNTAGTVRLGGALTQNTDITGDFDLSLGTVGSKLAAFSVYSSDPITLNSASTFDIISDLDLTITSNAYAYFLATGDGLTIDNLGVTLHQGSSQVYINATNNIAIDSPGNIELTSSANDILLNATSGSITLDTVDLFLPNIDTATTANTLYYNTSTGKITYGAAGGASYTFANGLTNTAGTVEFGGTLTEDTTLTGSFGLFLATDQATATVPSFTITRTVSSNTIGTSQIHKTLNSAAVGGTGLGVREEYWIETSTGELAAGDIAYSWSSATHASANAIYSQRIRANGTLYERFRMIGTGADQVTTTIGRDAGTDNYIRLTDAATDIIELVSEAIGLTANSTSIVAQNIHLDTDGGGANWLDLDNGLNTATLRGVTTADILGGGGSINVGDDIYINVLATNDLFIVDIPTATTSNVLYYNSSTGRVTYGAAGGGSGWALTGTTTLTGDVLIDSDGNNVEFDVSSGVATFILTSNEVTLNGGSGALELHTSLSALSGGVTVLYGTDLELRFDAGTTGAVFTDFRLSPAGIEYDADYSGTFTARSLVDKAYVDSVAGGASAALNIDYVSGTTYTFAEGDIGKVLHFTNASGCTATIPTGLSAGWHVDIYRTISAGPVTIESDGTLESTGDTLTVAMTAATIYHEVADNHVAIGAFGELFYLITQESGTTINLTETYGDRIVLCNCASNNQTVNLPSASGNNARITVKRIWDGSNTVTIDAAGADLIDGAGTQSLGGIYQSITLVCNGIDEWFII